MRKKNVEERNIIRIDRVLLCRIRRQKTFGHLVVKITFRVVAEARWPAKIMDHSRRVEVRAQVSPIEAQAYIHIPAGPFWGDITIVGITIATELRVPLGDKRLVRTSIGLHSFIRCYRPMLYNKTGNSRRNLPLSDEWEDAHWNLELCRKLLLYFAL